MHFRYMIIFEKSGATAQSPNLGKVERGGRAMSSLNIVIFNFVCSAFERGSFKHSPNSHFKINFTKTWDKVGLKNEAEELPVKIGT